MKTLHTFLSALGLSAASVLAFAHDHSAAAKNDCCAKDTACCTGSGKCSAADKANCSGDTACCKNASKCCAAETACCDDSAGCADDHEAKGAVATTAATADAKTSDLVNAYLPIAHALASDDLNKAQHAAADLARVAKANGSKAVYYAALGVTHASDLAAARTAFKTLSGVVSPLAENNKNYVVMTCPMAKADWVQTDANVRNPYYGSSMLTCGAPKKG